MEDRPPPPDDCMVSRSKIVENNNKVPDVKKSYSGFTGNFEVDDIDITNVYPPGKNLNFPIDSRKASSGLNRVSPSKVSETSSPTKMSKISLNKKKIIVPRKSTRQGTNSNSQTPKLAKDKESLTKLLNNQFDDDELNQAHAVPVNQEQMLMP